MVRKFNLQFIFLLILWFPITYPALSEIVPGEIVYHPADAEIEYNWFTYVPATIDKNSTIYILVNCDLSGYFTDYVQITEVARTFTEHRKTWAEQYRYVLLQPAIPRLLDTNRSPSEIYCVAFDRQVFDPQTPSFYQRPDLKINLMIDRLKSILMNDGYQVNAKAMFEGFSAGAMFAQRYALLHPERVQAVAAGTGTGSGQVSVREGGFAAVAVEAPSRSGRGTASTPPISSGVKVLFKPRPRYSSEARALQIEGEVLLDVLFTRSGEVRVLRVRRGLGYGLDEAAAEAARQIRFQPAQEAGRPVDSEATIRIRFQLAY